MIAELLTYLRAAPTRLAWFLALSTGLLIQIAAVGAEPVGAVALRRANSHGPYATQCENHGQAKRYRSTA